MTLNERAVLLNELAQGLRPQPLGLAWFEGLAEAEQMRSADAAPRVLRPGPCHR